MGDYRKKEIIKAFIAIIIIVLALFFGFTVVFKYQMEGDTRIPFKLSKITVVSSVEGITQNGTENQTISDIFQNNDVYFSIEKNEDSNKEDIIQSVSIQNIKVINNPSVGKIITYMPNSSDGRLFNNSEETIVNDKLTYRGSNKSDSKTLEIGNQGGTAVIRFSNAGLGKYDLNQEQQVEYNGSMLSKLNITEEQIKFKVIFDFVIKLTDKSYITTVSLDLPCKDLVKQGTSSLEVKDNFIFKRVK